MNTNRRHCDSRHVSGSVIAPQTFCVVLVQRLKEKGGGVIRVSGRLAGAGIFREEAWAVSQSQASNKKVYLGKSSDFKKPQQRGVIRKEKGGPQYPCHGLPGFRKLIPVDGGS